MSLAIFVSSPSRDLARKATDQARHFPGSQRVSRCSGRSTVEFAIVLFESSDRMRCATNVESLMTNGRSQAASLSFNSGGEVASRTRQDISQTSHVRITVQDWTLELCETPDTTSTTWADAQVILSVSPKPRRVPIADRPYSIMQNGMAKNDASVPKYALYFTVASLWAHAPSVTLKSSR
nr:hypothetical protein CFP56_58808 [Quercus suber]